MKRFTVCLLVLLACALVVAVSSAPAYAVDGVVLINQNTAVTGLPGCPTGGTFPIIICNPGSYKLSGNLVVPATTDGIDINADNVALDLNGFSISCPSGACKGNGTGILSSNSGITVHNGTVQGFLDGISVLGNNELVDHVQASNNGILGIAIFGGIVSNCSTFGNGEGIFAETALISGNSVSNNLGVGIWLNGNSSVTNNNITGNGTIAPNGTGIVVTTGNSSLTNNSITGNGAGLTVAGGFVGYGSNTFAGNSTDVMPEGLGTAVSMKNNACTAGVC